MRQIVQIQLLLFGNIGQQQFFFVVCVYVLHDSFHACTSGKISSLFFPGDQMISAGAEQAQKKLVDQKCTAEGSKFFVLKMGGRQLKKKTVNLMADRGILSGIKGVNIKLYIINLRKVVCKKGGRHLQGNDERRIFRPDLMTDVGIYDKDIVFFKDGFPAGGDHGERTVQNQADLEILMDMRGTIEQIYDKNMKVTVVMGDDLVFILACHNDDFLSDQKSRIQDQLWSGR